MIICWGDKEVSLVGSGEVAIDNRKLQPREVYTNAALVRRPLGKIRRKLLEARLLGAARHEERGDGGPRDELCGGTG